MESGFMVGKDLSLLEYYLTLLDLDNQEKLYYTDIILLCDNLYTEKYNKNHSNKLEAERAKCQKKKP